MALLGSTTFSIAASLGRFASALSWLYGLLRLMTHFIQTEPGNAVKEKINPGLQNVCHNITGGNLHAQGKILLPSVLPFSSGR